MKMECNGPAEQPESLSPAARALAAARGLDTSISLPLGSVFDPEQKLPVGDMMRRIAPVFGADWAFVSTNGTTAINVIALLTFSRSGATAVIQRDAHASAFSGLVLGPGVRPRYIQPRWDDEREIFAGVSPEDLDATLQDCRDVAFVWLTSPNYFGIASDLEACVAVCRRHGVPVIVDSAHGSHLGFHPGFPPSAAEAHPDVVTMSIHKTWNALSQGSVLLLNGDVSVQSRLYRVINNTGHISTSFSFPILASVDEAVEDLRTQGHGRLEKALGLAERLRRGIEQIPHLAYLTHDPGAAVDPLRVAVDVSGLELSGLDVEHLLYADGIYAEMASLRYMLLLVTPWNEQEDVTILLERLRDIAAAHPRGVSRPRRSVRPPRVPPLRLTPRVAFFEATSRVAPVDEAIGCISGETLSCYPPGAPVVVAGEEVTSDVIEYLCEMRDAGAFIKGASDPTLTTMEILEC